MTRRAPHGLRNDHQNRAGPRPEDARIHPDTPGHAPDTHDTLPRPDRPLANHPAPGADGHRRHHRRHPGGNPAARHCRARNPVEFLSTVAAVPPAAAAVQRGARAVRQHHPAAAAGTEKAHPRRDHGLSVRRIVHILRKGWGTVFPRGFPAGLAGVRGGPAAVPPLAARAACRQAVVGRARRDPGRRGRRGGSGAHPAGAAHARPAARGLRVARWPFRISRQGLRAPLLRQRRRGRAIVSPCLRPAAARQLRGHQGAAAHRRGHGTIPQRADHAPLLHRRGAPVGQRHGHRRSAGPAGAPEPAGRQPGAPEARHRPAADPGQRRGGLAADPGHRRMDSHRQPRLAFLHPAPHRPERPRDAHPEIPHHGPRRRMRAARLPERRPGPARRMGTRPEAEVRPARDPGRDLPAQDQPGRVAPAVERAQGRDEPGGPAPHRAVRGGKIRRGVRPVHPRQAGRFPAATT